jgi:hypothetical protein
MTEVEQVLVDIVMIKLEVDAEKAVLNPLGDWTEELGFIVV